MPKADSCPLQDIRLFELPTMPIALKKGTLSRALADHYVDCLRTAHTEAARLASVALSNASISYEPKQIEKHLRAFVARHQVVFLIEQSIAQIESRRADDE